jgi:predicted ATPase/DNA-binding SARP family transcriptional activator
LYPDAGLERASTVILNKIRPLCLSWRNCLVMLSVRRPVEYFNIECFGALRVCGGVPPVPFSKDNHGHGLSRTRSDEPDEERIVDRFRTYKTGALLAFLALNSGPQRREELCALLWPEARDDAARNSLSAALSALRREFGDDFIIADRNRVALNPDITGCDVIDFDRAIAAGNLAEAIRLYRGHLLPGFYEDTFLSLANEYQEKARIVWQKHLNQLELDGDLAGVRTETRRALRLFSDHYDLYLTLMRAHFALGEYVGALHVGDELAALVRRMGDPMPPAALALATRAREERSKQEVTEIEVIPPIQNVDALPSHSKEKEANKQAVLRAPLPPLWTRFFGRRDEIEALRSLICSGERLITLSGTGGSGKTRLALEALHALKGKWSGPIFFVPLASLWDASLLFSTIRDVLGIVASPDVPPLEQLTRALRGHECIMLLDNMEQLGQGGAEKLHKLRSALPAVTFLVTSRALLRLPGEREFAVVPLPIPEQKPNQESVSQSPSVALFCDRSRIEINRGNYAAIAELCRRLEGIPLALELAAARASVLSPSQMLELLEKRPDFLQSREVGIPQRQRTLRATIEWSTDLLTPQLRHFYARLSVFRDGWTLEAAEAVCSHCLCEPYEVLDYLEQLRSNSLVSTSSGPTGTRYHLLEMLREWGESELEEEEESALYARHLAFYTELAESALDPISLAMRGDEIAAENGNFRAALRRALAREDANAAQDAARLVAVLCGLWEQRAWCAEGREWAERALQKSGEIEPATKAHLYCCAGTMLWYVGDFIRAQSLLEEGLKLYRYLENPAGESLALDILGKVFVVTGRCDETRICGEMAVEIARSLNDIPRLLSSLVTAGWGCHNTKRPKQAIAYFDECIEIGKQLGEKRLVSVCEATKAFSLLLDGRNDECAALCEHLLEITSEEVGLWAYSFARGITGILDLAMGNLQRARVLLPDVTRRFHGISTRWEVASLLIESGNMAVELNDFERAALLYGATQELSERVSYDILPCLMSRYVTYLPRLDAALSASKKEALWKRGRSLSIEEAVALVGEMELDPSELGTSDK